MKRLVSILRKGGSRSLNDSRKSVPREVQVWGIHPLSEKPGNCQHIHISRSILMYRKDGNVVPIRSHPHPEEPLVHQAPFHYFDLSDVFKLHNLRLCKSWELLWALLPQARNFSVLDAFEAPWAHQIFKSLPDRKAPQPQRCHPATRSECHDIQRVRLYHQSTPTRNQVAPIFLVRRGSIHEAEIPRVSHDTMWCDADVCLWMQVARTRFWIGVGQNTVLQALRIRLARRMYWCNDTQIVL